MLLFRWPEQQPKGEITFFARGTLASGSRELVSARQQMIGGLTKAPVFNLRRVSCEEPRSFNSLHRLFSEGVSLFRAGTMKLRFIVPGRVHPLESTAVISNSIIPAGGIKYRPLKGFP